MDKKVKSSMSIEKKESGKSKITSNLVKVKEKLVAKEKKKTMKGKC